MVEGLDLVAERSSALGDAAEGGFRVMERLVNPVGVGSELGAGVDDLVRQAVGGEL